MIKLPKEWSEAITPYITDNDKYKLKTLAAFLEEERKNYRVFPPEDKIFNAYELCKPEDVKMVILGQDPYHEIGQAMGLAFSVPEGIQIPASLRNIYKELHDEFDMPIPRSGDLQPIAAQGVLMINSVLTVREGLANSHKNKGWEVIISATLKYLSNNGKPIVYMLWGRDAQNLMALYEAKRQLKLSTTHPSPLSASRGFLGCGHFIKANEYLEKNSIKPIDWRILK